MVALFEANDPGLIALIREGGIVAYPTEGVMGVGCDPFCSEAVAKIRTLKSRSRAQGFICVASDWSHCEQWVLPVAVQRMKEIEQSWPGPVTWVFRASVQAPPEVCAEDGSIALRISSHPVVRTLCHAFGAALVSTSANARGQSACLTGDDVKSPLA